jgi:cytochrome c oxidase cbb3-type subunit 2
MNSGPLVFLGLLVTMAVSWLAFVMGPQIQIGDLQPATNVVSALGERYPNPYEGEANQGSQVYRANGCVACHTQQVRAREFGPDIARYLAIRPSTGFDYLYDQPAFLGDQRIGPDLAAVGPHSTREGLLRKLYDPQSETPGSVMPPYRCLFQTRKIEFNPSDNALTNLPPNLAAPEGYEIVPTPKAEQLVSYLLSRRQNTYIYYAPPPPTNKPAASLGATNAPATNAPAAK